MGKLENQARYREKNREKIRAWNRAYITAKRRREGIPAIDSPESSENRRRARKLSGPAHQNWKGDQASYSAHHHWINLHKPRTGTCSDCGARPQPKSSFRKVGTEWANLSGEYRRDVDDYIEVCIPCHRRRDKGVRHG